MGAHVTFRRKLIEVAMPLPEINDSSAYDKMPGIGPHPKGIHQWWARLPLPVARAVLFASVVDDPSADVEKFPTEEAQARERERLFGILRGMIQKQLHKHPEVYAEARGEMLRFCEGRLPTAFDPFAGGGSISLEAARLGFEAHAGDLNPVCVLLNKCNLELAPRWAGRPPVNPMDRKKIGGTHGWPGTVGLAADVRYYGRLIHERVWEKLRHLYPPVKVTTALAEGRSDLKPYVAKELPVIAWIWARTVRSPDPAVREAQVPLMSTFWLSSKKGSEAWLEPGVNRSARTWRFAVRTGLPEDWRAVKAGTKTGRAQFRCLLTGAPIADEHIKEEGQAERIGTRLVAIVAERQRGRAYLPATSEQEAAAVQCAHPTEQQLAAELAEDPRNIWCTSYGLETFSQLFTARQLTAMVTLSDLVKEIREDVRRDAIAVGLSDQEAEAYARAVNTFLALALDRCADFNNSLCRWSPSNQKVMNLFGRQAIPMVWDFAEANVLGESVGAWTTCSEYVADCIEVITMNSRQQGQARQIDAATDADGLKNLLISTDPPYYDNISYAALSDFFYVWLRRTIGDFYPDLFQTILVPKEPELVASPERFRGNKQKAKEHFETGFRRAFAALREEMDPRFPLTVYYAFKQDDEESGADEEDENEANGLTIDRTTGWETMLEALIGTGFQITATWPVRASQKWRMRAMGANALASYIVLACRPRPADAQPTDRRSFVAALKSELPMALRELQQGNIAPVDFAQATIGPGMAIYSRYDRILEASGKPMTPRTALALINQTLTEVLSEQEDEFDAETRWAIAWFEQRGFEEGDFGEAELLSKAKVTSVGRLVEAGFVRSKGGKVCLLRPEELPAAWDPSKDRRLIVWEMTHHLLRVYYHDKQGDAATAELLRSLGARGDTARDLAYRLFDVCEKKHRSAEAQAYNALVLGWPEVVRLARESDRLRPQQAGLFAEPHARREQ
jgi:putative DNA methylase